MKTTFLLIFSLVLVIANIASSQNIRATTDEGQTVILQKNGTWFFISHAKTEDDSAVIFDGRGVVLKKKGKWFFSNTTRSVSSATQRYNTQSAPNIGSLAGQISPSHGKTSHPRQSNDPGRQTSFRNGQQVPFFIYRDADGSEVNINSFRGKVVLINFWASWCGPCREEMPRLEKEIWQQFNSNDFTMIALTSDDNEEVLKQIKQEFGFTFPMAYDAEKRVSHLFAVNSIPRNYVVGKDGRILFQSIGYGAEHFDEMKGVIEQALKNE